MTRAQIRIISARQGIDFLYGIGSDGYPDRIVKDLEAFDGDIKTLTKNLYMDLNPAANACYYYEINCDTQTLTYWESQMYWRNAPKDWKERGWNCWENKKTGKSGWTEWRKGKKLGVKSLPYIHIQILPETRYTKEAIKALPDTIDKSQNLGLVYFINKAKNIPLFHTFVSGCEETYKILYDTPFEDIPLHTNDPYNSGFYKWRLTHNL